MKKVLIAAIAVFTFGVTTAQEKEKFGFSREDLFISGGVNLRFTENADGSENNGFKISPKIGYFVSNHVALGVGLSVGEVRDEQKLKTQEFVANVFGRYYVTPSKQFSAFAELAAGFKGVREGLVGGGRDNTESFNVAFAPGISYFVSEHFALEASIGLFEYNTSKPANHVADQPRTDKFDLGLNLREIKLGLVYKF